MNDLKKVLDEIRWRRVACRDNNVAPGTAQEDAIYRICEDIVSEALSALTPSQPLPVQEAVAQIVKATSSLVASVVGFDIEFLTDDIPIGSKLYLHPAPSSAGVVGEWQPISHADKTITDVQDFSEVGITIKTSDRYWVRDEDGRVYEAAWSEGKYGRDYWWDFEGESPVDPVEFMPHPLDPRFLPAAPQPKQEGE